LTFIGYVSKNKFALGLAVVPTNQSMALIIFLMFGEKIMRTISLLTTAILAIALYGCNTEKHEAVQDKPDIVESKRSDVKSKARDLEPITSNPRKRIATSARRAQPRNVADADRDYADRDYADRDYADRDDADRDYADRDDADRDYADRDYADRDYAERDDAERDDADRASSLATAARDFADRDYAERADVGSAAAASTADYR
jgi:hypothetical protein